MGNVGLSERVLPVLRKHNSAWASECAERAGVGVRYVHQVLSKGVQGRVLDVILDYVREASDGVREKDRELEELLEQVPSCD